MSVRGRFGKRAGRAAVGLDELSKAAETILPAACAHIVTLQGGHETMRPKSSRGSATPCGLKRKTISVPTRSFLRVSFSAIMRAAVQSQRTSRPGSSRSIRISLVTAPEMEVEVAARLGDAVTTVRPPAAQAVYRREGHIDNGGAGFDHEALPVMIHDRTPAPIATMCLHIGVDSGPATPQA